MAVVVKNPPAIQEKVKKGGFDSWVGKIPGGGQGNPFQYSYLQNPVDREAWLQSIALHRVGHD